MQQLAKDKERETRLCVVRGGGGGVAEGLRSRHQAVLFFCSIAKKTKSTYAKWFCGFVWAMKPDNPIWQRLLSSSLLLYLPNICESFPFTFAAATTQLQRRMIGPCVICRVCLFLGWSRPLGRDQIVYLCPNLDMRLSDRMWTAARRRDWMRVLTVASKRRHGEGGTTDRLDRYQIKWRAGQMGTGAS